MLPALSRTVLLLNSTPPLLLLLNNKVFRYYSKISEVPGIITQLFYNADLEITQSYYGFQFFFNMEFYKMTI